MNFYKKKPNLGFFTMGMVLLGGFLYSQIQTGPLQEEVAAIFKQSCSITGCHAGSYPSMNLNLEQDKFFDKLINRPSEEIRELKRVDLERPERSYLLMKVKGASDIVGMRMPRNAPPLDAVQIEIIENWVKSLKGTTPAPKSAPDLSKQKPRSPAFWGTRLVNLPTTRPIGGGQVLFRISHRYFPAVKDGYDSFYGLDGPAAIFLSLGYGITDNLSLTLGRSNLLKEAELDLSWRIFDQELNSGLPFSAALHTGTSLITRSQPGESRFRAENWRFNIQLSLSHRINDSISVLLVPSYSSNTNPVDDSSEGTFTLGTGARLMFLRDLSIIAEWTPILAGYKSSFSGWGIGLEKKIGGHVFQVFIINTAGLTTPQYLPGGDLHLSDSEFRLGFNIFRWF